MAPPIYSDLRKSGIAGQMLYAVSTFFWWRMDVNKLTRGFVSFVAMIFISGLAQKDAFFVEKSEQENFAGRLRFFGSNIAPDPLSVFVSSAVCRQSPVAAAGSTSGAQ